MTRLNPIVMLMACLLIAHISPAQDSVSVTDKVLSFPARFLNKVSKKSSNLETDLINKTERYLKKISKEENRIKKKLFKSDSVLAKQLFENAQSKYQTFQLQLKQKSNINPRYKEYIPFMDTLTTSLHFLEKNAIIINNKLATKTLGSINGLEGRFQQAAKIQQFLSSRRQYLKSHLVNLGMFNELKKYNKQIYYYNAQVEEYKSILKEPKKIERKAIDLLSKSERFQDFMRKNSMLASIFRLPDNSGNASNIVSVPGLQTSSQVNAMLQQTVGIAGPNNTMQNFQSNLQQVQSQLVQVKDKINALGGKSESDIPNFRPNSQRVKGFWRRWELGTNVQSTRSNIWLPTATQIGLSAGYKLNDRSIVGVGMAGSIGWGKSVKHIVVSYEGVGARSFLDWKLKGSVWLSAGYELNFRSTFTRIEQLNTLNKWQQSGLVGISKKYKVGKKIKGSMNLLWDYLSYSQIPRTQPIVFRFGYNLK